MKIRNLSKITPAQRRRYVLPGVVAEKGNGKDLVLVLVHAGDTNKPWRDATDKLDAQLGGGAIHGEEWVRDRIPAFARHAIVDWENAFDDSGKPEPYKPAAGEKLLRELFEHGGGDLVYGPMRYAFDPKNFRDTAAETLDEGAAERVGNA